MKISENNGKEKVNFPYLTQFSDFPPKNRTFEPQYYNFGLFFVVSNVVYNDFYSSESDDESNPLNDCLQESPLTIVIRRGYFEVM